MIAGRRTGEASLVTSRYRIEQLDAGIINAICSVIRPKRRIFGNVALFLN